MAQETNKLATDNSVIEINPAADTDAQSRNNQREQKVLEINQQMSMLEDSIEALDGKLVSTNQQIQSDVERLTDSDADITEKFATTYKQLGIIEASLQELSDDSGRLNTELDQVNTNIRVIEQEATAALKDAVENQSEVNETFHANHEAIVERADKLAKKATALSSKLTKSINQNSKALAELEARIVNELESVAQASEQRDADLSNQVEIINKEVSSQKAKMLLMQDVDAALEKRATSLEDISNKLSKDTTRLKKSTKDLNLITAKLGTDVEALQTHTQQLAEQNTEQQGFINSLLERTTILGDSLLAQARIERKHFHIMSVISLLIILTIVGVYYVNQHQRELDLIAQSAHDNVVNEQVTVLQNQLSAEQAAKTHLQQEVVGLQQNIATMEDQIQGMNDQVESLDGRVQYLAPLNSFGGNNTIHGSHWLQQLQPEQFSIHIAAVTDKQEMYKIAQRYNRYFVEELAYYIDDKQQYHLIYGGKFATQQQALQTINRMPRYISHQPINVIANHMALAQITH